MSNASLTLFERALQQCEAESIHQIGQIQPHAALLVLSQAGVVLQASSNLGDFIELASDAVLGLTLAESTGFELAAQLEKLIEICDSGKPVTGVVRLAYHNVMRQLLARVFETADMFVLELMVDAGDHSDKQLVELLLNAQHRLFELSLESDTGQYFDRISSLVRELCGFDRVMVYRFDSNWDGEVIAESRAAFAASYLGTRFPASDIPPQARRLYTSNLVRHIADVNARPVSVLPTINPHTGQPLDMTHSAVRSLSAVHIEYLCNMGVQASMSISLLQNGRLWGLIACHHLSPRYVSNTLQEAVAFVGQIVSAKLALLETYEQRNLDREVTEIISELLKSSASESSQVIPQQLLPKMLALLDANGIILRVEGQHYEYGEVPDPADISELLHWLESQDQTRPFACECLMQSYPPAARYAEQMAGVLAITFSVEMQNCILWLRKEKLRTVQWAGHTEKTLVETAAGIRLSPRKSFEIWTESWRGRSQPWSYVQIAAAQILAQSVIDGLSQKIKLEIIDTERQLALANQRESDARYRRLVDGVKDVANIMLDMNGCVITWNEGAARIKGYASEEIIGRHFSVFYPEEEVRAGKTERELLEALQFGRCEDEGWRVRKDGSQFFAHVVITALYDEQNRILGYSKITRDITERKKAEKIMMQAKESAEVASRAKSDFLAAMSHEIRTPMNGVIGMLDVLAQSSLKGYQVEMVDMIRDSSHTLLAIIEDILDFSKIEAGKLALDMAPVSLEQVIEKVCALLEQVALRKQVELMMYVDPEIPPLLEGDELRLRQILINLVNNAIKFSSSKEKTGQVSVRATLAAYSDGVAQINLMVTDNGIGMNEAMLARLFSPFEQADNSTTRRYGGTGLGLVISQKLTNLMGGEISVQSEPGVGSIFSVHLPMRVLQEKDLAPSMVADLPCFVIGRTALSDLIVAHLEFAQARVVQVDTIAIAREITSGEALFVWILDAACKSPSSELMQQLREASEDSGARLLLIQRGRRRVPRRVDNQLVMVDGDLITRRIILQAASIAAGRMDAFEQKHEKENKLSVDVPTHQEAVLQGRLILVAEDNPTNQNVIRRQLGLLGLAAEVGEDGDEAFRMWESGEYALLLTDLHMPNMDGYELTAAIRARELNAGGHMTIIALTANAMQGEAQRCIEAGMDAYLSKPVRLADLKATLLQWLPELMPVGESTLPTTSIPAAIVPPAHVEDGLYLPLDVGILKSYVGDEDEIVSEFLRDYSVSTEHIVEEMHIAFNEADLPKMRALSHKLKSSSRSVGALKLGELCEQIERASQAGNRDDVAPLFNEFVLEYKLIQRYLAGCNAPFANAKK